MDGSDYCYAHDPERAEERKRNASRGGKRGGRGRPLTEIAGVKEKLRQLADDVIENRINRSSAAVASQVLNVYLRAVSVELKVRETEELAREVEELRELLEAQKGERRYGA